jgi:hypothetical protein
MRRAKKITSRPSLSGEANDETSERRDDADRVKDLGAATEGTE